ADGGADAFYRGELGARVAAFAATAGGLLDADDLAAHRSTWVEPIATGYRGYDVYEVPPSSQGVVALLGLNVLERFDLGGASSVDVTHLAIEAAKIAFAERVR